MGPVHGVWRLANPQSADGSPYTNPSGSPVSHETGTWVGDIEGQPHDRMVNAGLIERRAATDIGPQVDRYEAA